MSRCRLPITLLLLLSACATDAGVVRGRVGLPGGPTSSGPSGDPFRQAVVWVDSLPERELRRYGKRDRVKLVVQGPQGFSPQVIAVTAGTTVRFQNRDRVYHNVFSISPAKKFDLGKYPPEAVNQVTFDRPGVVSLYCDLHAEEAWVVVAPSRVYAMPGRSGRFVLPKLRPGHYTLCAWHPTRGTLSRSFEMPRRGDVRLRLSY